MQKKFTKKVLLILVVLCSIFVVYRFNFGVVKADSGFDTSYDSGGWDSGSDWGGSDWGGSDWDFSSSSSSSSSRRYSSNEPWGILDYLTFLIPISIYGIIIFGAIFSSKPKPKIPIILDHSKELNDEQVKQFISNFNKEEFLNNRYQDYLDIQDSWMKFDYDKLRSLLTDELYNQYKMQLESMQIKGEVNIMKDFKYKDSMITNITCENNQISITIELICLFKDYIEHNQLILRGAVSRNIIQHYEITFVCNLEDKLDECPNCGAKVSNDASQTCKYCNSIIAKVSDKWVLSKKESKEQGWE